MNKSRILAGDCVIRMNTLEKESIDHIITDPPYEIGFMGKGWDNSGVAYNPKTWEAAHRVLKPDGIMVVFGATRTHHRIADAIIRADFEIIDIIAWTYGTGFPKSHNIGKAIEKINGSPSTVWSGWGTALKPAWEPIIIARKKGSSSMITNYSQFNYIPKAGKKERNRGLEEFPQVEAKTTVGLNSPEMRENRGREAKETMRANNHPTVKPVNLMKKLVLDFTNDDETILDPFMGSGSTGIACALTNRKFVGIELTPEYIPLATARIKDAVEKPEGWI